jgi:hypothetical protein
MNSLHSEPSYFFTTFLINQISFISNSKVRNEIEEEEEENR